MVSKLKRYLPILFDRPRLGNAKILPEQRLQIDVADYLRAKSIDGSLSAVWTHSPNEGKRSRIVGAILKAMGLIPGTSDLCFMWANGSGVIELKVGENRLTQNQEHFFDWCMDKGVNYRCCYSLAEVVDTLVEWKVLTV